MSSSRARLRAAAFGLTCELDPVPLLAADDAAESAWLAAVVLGAQGRYAAAAAVLRGLRRAAPVIASLAASTLASHRRQLGGHGPARTLDAAALRIVGTRPGPDAAAARHDALLGLAADAVGLGRPEEARRLLAHAGGHRAGTRQRVRSGWVGAECALLVGDHVRAVREARAAAADAQTVGSFRHITKSRVVLAAARAAEGTESSRAHARALVEAALQSSLDRGLVSLTWPSAQLLGSLSPQAHGRCRDLARTALSSIFERSDPAGRRIMAASPWVPEGMLRTGDTAAANG